MGRIDERDWPRRLAPLVLGAEPLDDQIRRRFGIALVASGLLIGMALFLLAVFAGFGQGRIGLALAGPVVLVAAGIGVSYARLRRSLDAYRAAHPEPDAAVTRAGRVETPTGRPSSG